MSANKLCSQCKVIKDISEYHLRKKNGKTSQRAECKDCYRENGRKRYKKNKEVIIARNKVYYDKNRDKLLDYRKQWNEYNKSYIIEKRKERYRNNEEKIKLKRKEYYYNNKEKCLKSVSDYSKKNKEYLSKKKLERERIKMKTDLNYKLSKRLRGRINMAVKNKVKKKLKSFELIGCTVDFLIEYLENKFTEGMSWDNYGDFGWHIDHIVPCASFDLTDEEQQKKCFHYTNMQPLWAVDNLKKGKKLNYDKTN
jgi:hypothetical protein